MRRILADLQPGRLITLTGSQGVGKTRLAIEAGHRLAERFDSVVTVWLGTVHSASEVPTQIARAGDWPVSDERAVDAAVVAHLRETPTLVVLDNCEHVDGIGTVIDHVLRACPTAAVLATSPRPLACDLERVIEIEPLPVDASIELLVHAARRNDPRFAVTDANRDALAELATQLGGIPLALYLAAARLHVTTPDQMVRLLDRRFDVLTGLPSFEAPHRALLLTMIEWTYRLQTEVDQQRFRALGVFPHTFTREAAAAVAGCDPVQMLDTLQALVDHHLVRAMEREGVAARFGLLESMREFALTELAEHGELEAAQRAHAVWLTELAERDGPGVAAGDADAWGRLLTEIDNVRAATAWAVTHDRRLVLRLGVLWRFWQRTALVDEGIAALTSALAADPPADAVTAHAMRALANLHHGVGNLDEAVRWADHAVAAYERFGDEGERARAWICLAHPERERGHIDRAVALYEAAAATFQRLGWRRDEGTALNGLAAVADQRGDVADAIDHWEHCLAIARELDDPELAIPVSTNLGVARLRTGDLRGALAASDESIELAERINAPTLVAAGLVNRVEVLLALRETERARADLERLDALLDPNDRRTRAVLHTRRGVLAEHEGRLRDALGDLAAGLALALETGCAPEAAEIVEYAIRVADELDDLELAALLGAAAGRIRLETGSAPATPIADDLARVAGRVGASGLAIPEGDAPSADAALAALRAAAVRLAGEQRTRSRGDDLLRAFGLTPRESQVARLLAVRRTDPEIAAELSISVRTVATHVSAVLRKLSVKSRREVAATLAGLDNVRR